jgi:hypothetical protein
VELVWLFGCKGRIERLPLQVPVIKPLRKQTASSPLPRMGSLNNPDPLGNTHPQDDFIQIGQ